MGDYSSPKRRDVFDRLRRRIELYRKHHSKAAGRYDNTINSLYERGGQESLLLRERWLQSKAKKASKSKKDSTSGDHRNTGITKLLKRKIDNNHSETQNLDTSAFDFDDSDTITTKKTLKSGSGVDVSVRIVQEITGGNSQQVQTNVAVSTTVKTHIGSGSEHKENSSTSVETNTKFECKQEPSDDIQCVKSNKSDISHTGSSEILDQEELEEILKTIEKDEGKLSDEIFEELQKFDQIYIKVSQEDSNDSTMFNNMTGTSPGLHKQHQYDPANVGSSGGMFENSQSNSGRTPSVPYRPPGAITTMTETGPAAETLKQMAAQHQSSQHHASTYGVKQFNPHVQNNSYNSYPSNMDPSYSNQQGYVPQPNMNMQNGLLYQERHSDMYSSTKPLAHYPGSSANNTPSSLQQLQNQVQSFTQSKQMDITQTQQIQVNDESRRMQMSQTQQIHMRQPPQNISLSQHQSFSMSNNMNQRQSPGYMTEQMKMQQMYQEKVQQEHHQKMQAVQMQQYNMGPPPEYKMQPSAQEAYSTNIGRQNPLQTMQDMVEQTNSIPNLNYNGKSESPNSHMIPPAPMSGVQHGPVTSTHNPARLMSQNDLNPTGYHMSHMQRQQSYPGAHLDTHMSLQNRQNGNNFTSSIMRNQRPPNVNVGPDGLNISQPRNQDWPRHMLPQQGMPKPQNQNIMYNNAYASQTRTSVANSMGIRPMQMPSQTAMMQNNPQTQHMMMQHQNIHMTQRMAVPGHVNTPNNPNFNQRQHQDDFMKILDSGNSDFIDNMAAQSSGVSSDAAWLDEILSGK